ncbi:TPA: RHS repeat domain-containing protein [Neisseria subflava]
MAQLGGQTVPKKDAAPLSDGLDSQTPLRITEFKRDILGRLIHTLARNNDKAQETAYQYDLDGNLVRTGNLTHSTDQRTGTTHFEYDKLGRITKAGNEMFAFDPAHNILSDHNSPTVPDNRLKTYNGSSYYYDCFGNLIHRELADGEVQNYFYDLYDQLVKAEIFKKDGTKETWAYTYDALGRRIGKGRLKNEEVSDDLEEETRFIWDGSHLLQEIQPDGRYTYLYTDPDSYEPLAQVRNWTNEDGESRQQTHYFHYDQIGIPREMTDKDGNLVWFGDYYGWGRLKEETKVTDSAYQPFHLQNQYCDRETGLHYNFFRYYEPDAGRFINQDPIRLLGGDNFYWFAPNSSAWIDVLGLASIFEKLKITTSDGFLFKGFTVKAPFNIPVQRFGDLHLNSSRGDFWGLRIGTNKFINRTFAAILPSWNPLTNYNSGVIPKGTKMKVGIIGPQGLKYPGGSLQFIVHSEEVQKVKSKKIKRKGKC